MLKPPVAMSMIDVFQLQRSYKNIFCMQLICTAHTPDFFKDVSFHVSFHVKFGYMECCDFSTNNPQNTCLVT